MCGQTGSGKTTLARFLLESRNLPILVFDWKGLIKWPGFKRFTTLQSFIAHARKPGLTKSVYAPNIKEIKSWPHFETFFKFAYLKKNCQVYVDEVYAITDGDNIPDWYHACLTRGREHGISLFSSTQRPMRIPQVILSEAEHFYIFRLQMKQDRAKVESMTTIPATSIIDLPKYKFIYANAEGDTQGPLKLTIKKAA